MQLNVILHLLQIEIETPSRMHIISDGNAYSMAQNVMFLERKPVEWQIHQTVDHHATKKIGKVRFMRNKNFIPLSSF